jgi:hypothetical protein
MKKKTTSKEKSNINKTLLLLSIILVIVSILIKESTAIRPILWIIAIIITAINMKKNTKLSKSKIIMISLILLFSSIIIDGVIVYTFKRIPVFTYSIIKKDNNVVYTSLGMRVWQCNEEDYDNLKVDPFYKKGYMCNAKEIETIDINTFLNTIVQNHSEYKNNYVKIKGKISKKSGINSIEMRPYTETENKVNGYVEFADNITLKIIFKENDINLDSYDVYDEITVVGVIKNMDSNQGNHTIYMSDTILVSSINLAEYTLTTTKEKKCNKESIQMFNNDEISLHKYCLKEVLVTFPDGQYELSAAISSNKITIDSLYKDPVKKETNQNGAELYKFEDYNILVCQNKKDIYIGHTKMKITDIKCEEESE